LFVAREPELAKLDEHLKAALAGQGRVVFVTGDAGSGKTALMQEFARQAMATHGDLLIAAGSCNAQSAIGDPYLPFVEILQLLTGDIEAKRAACTERSRSAVRCPPTMLVACGRPCRTR
jgi:predicted ATPase